MPSAILSGFSRVRGSIHSPVEESISLLFPRMDDDEARELYERERCGCPLCLSTSPWADHRRSERHDDTLIGEGELQLAQEDFRTNIDERSKIDPRLACFHPECAADEAFLGNVSREIFTALRWKTKRLGNTTLTRYGRPLKKRWHPLFVKINELIEDGMVLKTEED